MAMQGPAASSGPPGSGRLSRTEFLAERRRLGPLRMDVLFAPRYDDGWGRISNSHRTFVQRLIDSTPDSALLLDAAFGTGKYWPQLRAARRNVVGIDRSAGMLAQASAKLPDVEVQQLTLERLGAEASMAGRFDGLLCVDAMELVPPEDWPTVLAGFASVVKPASVVYLTVEIPESQDLQAALSPAPPLVRGEVLWPDDHGGGYHFYPEMDQVTAWLRQAGLTVRETCAADGYQHVLAQADGVGPTVRPAGAQ
jgi:Methyltransferase domain